MGPVLTGIARVRATSSFVRVKGMSRRDAREYVKEIADEVFETAVLTVAKAKSAVLEFGDGQILDKILSFLNEHWDEIFALILKLIGMV